MNDNQLYEKGYSDGYHNVNLNTELFLEESYNMGREDGIADREAGAEPRGVKSAFIGDRFEMDNEPPEGYEWVGQFRTPERGEVYLTKAGNAGVAKTVAKNGRQRHMLKAIRPCAGHSYYKPTNTCKFAAGHKGRCSDQQLK